MAGAQLTQRRNRLQYVDLTANRLKAVPEVLLQLTGAARGVLLDMRRLVGDWSLENKQLGAPVTEHDCW